MTLKQAQADFHSRLVAFNLALVRAGMGAQVTCGERTMAEQAALYAKGRTAPGPKVTNAKPGQSAHNYDLARDYIPVTNGRRTYSVSAAWWVKFGAIARKSGLKWGGTFKKLLDRPHVEYPGWEQFRGKS